MEKQLIISVGREFGSGGHLIAEKLAEKFNLPLYDYNLLKEIAKEKDIEASRLEQYDEIPKNRLFSRSVRGYNNSPQENIANMQFEFIQKKAKEGKSFVIVGRCSEAILKEYPGLVSIFILADMKCKIERISNLHNLTNTEAEVMINRQNKKRKEYHNYYCTGKWGDSRNYDISINSSKLGIDLTVDILERYIKERIK